MCLLPSEVIGRPCTLQSRTGSVSQPDQPWSPVNRVTLCGTPAGIGPGLVTPKNVAAAPGSHLIALGDTIPVPALHAVISIGDVLIIIATIAAAMRAMPRHSAPHPDLNPEEAV